ncbi:MAG: pseudouridine synthase [Actinomycetota bacterium]|nr:pseudouridine synthase [Actinomycetota bacterium]
MSRRKAEELIRDGRVTLDGDVAVLGDRGDPLVVKVAVDGVPLPLRPELEYVLLNKPRDVISTAADPQGRETVTDLVDVGTRVYPVGRLDADSEGLLILTNDGTLTHLVTHPSNQVTKTYLALVEGNPGTRTVRELLEGVELKDGQARAAGARVVDRYKAGALIEVVMTEGRKREVRRMLAELGHPVERLVRTAIGPLQDKQLVPGSWRKLTLEEVRSLYAAAGATWEDGPEIMETDVVA